MKTVPALLRVLSFASAWPVEIDSNDARDNAPAVDDLFISESIFLSVFLAEDDIVSHPQPLRFQICRQLGFAFSKVTLIGEDLGLDNIFFAAKKDHDIRSAASGWHFGNSLPAEPLNEKIDESIQRIMPRTFFQMFGVKGPIATSCHILDVSLQNGF
jgi:hypothetical protein